MHTNHSVSRDIINSMEIWSAHIRVAARLDTPVLFKVLHKHFWCVVSISNLSWAAVGRLLYLDQPQASVTTFVGDKIKLGVHRFCHERWYMPYRTVIKEIENTIKITSIAPPKVSFSFSAGRCCSEGSGSKYFYPSDINALNLAAFIPNHPVTIFCLSSYVGVFKFSLHAECFCLSKLFRKFHSNFFVLRHIKTLGEHTSAS